MSGGACTECINEKGGFFASARIGTVFTLIAQFRFRCSAVLLQPKTHEPPNIGASFKELGPVVFASGGFGADFTRNSLLATYRPDLLHPPLHN